MIFRMDVIFLDPTYKPCDGDARSSNAVTSPIVTFTTDRIIQVTATTQGTTNDIALDVYTAVLGHVDTLIERLALTVAPPSDGDVTTISGADTVTEEVYDVCMPSGSYSVMFVAVTPNISSDLITVSKVNTSTGLGCRYNYPNHDGKKSVDCNIVYCRNKSSCYLRTTNNKAFRHGVQDLYKPHPNPLHPTHSTPERADVSSRHGTRPPFYPVTQ